MTARSASKPFNHRLLGTIAMITAPAMTLEAARHGFQNAPVEHSDIVGAVLYALFALGWLASLLGLWRLRATGQSRAGRAVLVVLLVTVTLALLQSLMDVLKVPTNHPLYLITDLAWPLSMVLMLVAGVAAVFARQLPGWKRFVPLYCVITLPLIAALMAFGVTLPLYLLDLHLLTGWTLLGYVVFSTQARYAAPTRTTPTVLTTT